MEEKTLGKLVEIRRKPGKYSTGEGTIFSTAVQTNFVKTKMPKTAKSWEQSRLTDLKIVYWALVDGLPPPKSKKYIHLFNPISIEGLMTMATLRQEHAQAACGQTKGCLSRKGGQEEVGSGGWGQSFVNTVPRPSRAA